MRSGRGHGWTAATVWRNGHDKCRVYDYGRCQVHCTISLLLWNAYTMYSKA